MFKIKDCIFTLFCFKLSYVKNRYQVRGKETSSNFLFKCIFLKFITYFESLKIHMN